MRITKLDEKNFDHVLQNTKDMICVFGASWCVPCRNIKNLIESLHIVESNIIKRVQFFTVDVEECQSLSMTYRIRSLPTILHIRSGIVQDTHVGSMSRGQLMDMVHAT